MFPHVNLTSYVAIGGKYCKMYIYSLTTLLKLLCCYHPQNS